MKSTKNPLLFAIYSAIVILLSPIFLPEKVLYWVITAHFPILLASVYTVAERRYFGKSMRAADLPINTLLFVVFVHGDNLYTIARVGNKKDLNERLVYIFETFEKGQEFIVNIKKTKIDGIRESVPHKIVFGNVRTVHA